MRILRKSFAALFVLTICLSIFGLTGTAHAAPKQPSSTLWVEIWPSYSGNACAGSQGGSTQPYTFITLVSCTAGHPPHTTYWSNGPFVIGGKHYTRLTNWGSNLCMGTEGQRGQGTAVTQEACTSSSDQAWRLISYPSTDPANPSIKILNVNSGLCIGLSGGVISVNSVLLQLPCNGSRDQHWSNIA